MGDVKASKAQISFARAVIYRVLSRCFSYPGKELIELFDSARVEEFFQSWRLLGLSAQAITPVTSWLAGLDGHDTALSELEKEFVRLFAKPYPEVLVQPYSSVYLNSERLIWGRSTAEVTKLYEAAGLGMNQNFHDVPDHIAAELEFASYLIAEHLKSNEHDSPSLEQLVTLEKKLLTEHLHRWAPAFFSRVVECSSAGFYQATALMGHQFIERDVTYLSRL
jgi:TorA maturation chaperone TorD